MLTLDRSVADPSAAAATARRLSLKSTEATLRGILARVAIDRGRLDDVLSEYGEPLIAFGPHRRILTANAAAERFFGYGRGELHDKPTDVLVPPRFRQPEAPPMLAMPDVTTVELPGLRRDGSEVPLAWTFGSVQTEGEPIFVLILRDRNEIERALEALHESEERFRLLVDGVRDHAIFMLDAKGHVATWNIGAERIKGWTAAEIIGQPYEAFFTPEDRAAGVPAAALAKAAALGRHDMTGWRMRKSGSRFFAEASLSALWTREGELRGFAKVTHDLTQRWVAEESERRLAVERAARHAAEATEDSLRRLHRAAVALSQAATPEEVASAVLEQCLGEVDASAGALYMISDDGLSMRLLGGRGGRDGVIDHFTQLALAEETPGTDAARSRTALFFESAEACAKRYPAIAGSFHASGFEALAVLPLVARGTTTGILALRYPNVRRFDEADRSLLLTMSELCAQALERARLFAAEKRARADAEAASRAKDEFLAMLGHELRNPLAPITTAVQLMKVRNDEHGAREREVIERQLRHLSTLVDDLLDVARIARGKLELSCEVVEITEILAKAVEMASPLLEQRRHHLAMTAPRGELFVDGDPLRLAQIVSNLLNNAAKYTPPNGHVELGAMRDGRDVVIRVRDDGVGIAPELLPEVFELFVQGKRTFDRSEGGLGLGLALVRNLVAAHGGTVSASSPGPGKGSEFVVRLPAVDARPTSASDGLRAIAQPRRRMRVLIVDDNEDAAALLAEALSWLGYETVFALDGHAALERLRHFQAEAAVLDLGLPVIDGFELARRITHEFPARRPRLIALTGYGQVLDRERTQDAGFDAHLVKPVDVSAVVAALEVA